MSAIDLMSSTSPGNRSKTQSTHATTQKPLHVMKVQKQPYPDKPADIMQCAGAGTWLSDKKHATEKHVTQTLHLERKSKTEEGIFASASTN